MILGVPFLVVTNMNIYCIIMLEMLLQFYYKRRKNKKDAGHVKKKFFNLILIRQNSKDD